MKELLKQIYIKGIKRYDHYITQEDHRSFEQWYESNKHLIDSAIEQYLKEQGKCIIDKSKIIDYLGQLEEIKQDVISIPDCVSFRTK